MGQHGKNEVGVGVEVLKICWVLVICMLCGGMVEETRAQPQFPTLFSNIATGRIKFSGLVVDDLVYVLGGFVHLSEGGEAVDVVDVYHINGTQLPSLKSKMLTPRGSMSVVLLEKDLIVAIGGIPAYYHPMALSSVEVLNVTCDCGWKAWGNLSFPRVQPTVSQGFGGAVVALGLSGKNEEVVEYIDPSSQATTPLFSLPEDLAGAAGTLGSLDDNDVLFFAWSILGEYNSSSVVALNASATGWVVVKNFPLLQFYSFSSVLRVDSAGALFIMTVDGHNRLFALENGNVSVSLCGVLATCPSTGVWLAAGETWVCLNAETSSTEERKRARLQYAFETGAAQWAQYGGNPQRNGQALGDWACIPPPQFGKAWTYKASAASSPVIGWDGSVYFLSVWGFDSKTYEIVALTSNGELKWNLTSLDYGYGAPVIGSNNIVITLAGAQNGSLVLVGIDGDTGTVLYQTPIPGHYQYYYELEFPITITDANEVLVQQEGYLVYVDASNGEIIRTVPWMVSKRFSTLPTVGEDGTLYVCWENSNGYQYNEIRAILPNGTIGKWSDGSVCDLNDSNFALSNDILYYFERTSYTYGNNLWFIALNLTAGYWQWRDHGFAVNFISVGYDGTAYICTPGAPLKALAAENGKVKWTYTQNEKREEYSGVVVGSVGTIFVMNVEWGVIDALDAETGASLWTYYLDGFDEGSFMEPAMSANGMLVVALQNGNVTAFGGGSHENLWQTTKLHFS